MADERTEELTLPLEGVTQPKAVRDPVDPAYLEAVARRTQMLGPCTEWEGTLNNNGYGPHKKLYEQTYGPVPKGYDVCHLCHNRACKNPTHLTLETRSGNMRMSRDRPKRKPLTPAQLKAIRDLRAAGHQQRQIADLLGINGSTVCKVLIGMTYKDK